jgi:SAM-dependent methyltransferase
MDKEKLPIDVSMTDILSIKGFKLNLGCGHTKLPGFVNIDKMDENGPDLIFDLNMNGVRRILPYADNTVDFVFGSHIIEHIRNIFDLFRELYRVCKPGSKLMFITPYATSDDAFESLDHCRLLNENSWMYLDKITNEGCAYAIDFDFKVIQTVLIPYPEFLNDKEIEFKRKHWRNVIREMRVLLEVKK